MSKPNYYELLKHPKWQAMRLKIMERAEFTCQWCYSQDDTLNVHHTYYAKNAAPWEYPESSLLCLCEGCHKKAHVMWDQMNALVSRLATTIYGSELERVIGYAKAVLADYERCYERPDDFEFTEEEGEGVANFFGIGAHRVWDADRKTSATKMWALSRQWGYRFREVWERVFKGSEGE